MKLKPVIDKVLTYTWFTTSMLFLMINDFTFSLETLSFLTIWIIFIVWGYKFLSKYSNEFEKLFKLEPVGEED